MDNRRRSDPTEGDGRRRSHPLERAFSTGAFEYLPVGALCLVGTAVTAVNSEWRSISGLSSDESEGVGWCQVVHPDDRGSVLACIEGGDDSEVDVRLEGPAVRWVRFRFRPVERSGLSVGTVTVLGEHRSSEARLLHLSRHDGLTGLVNRAELVDRIRHHLTASHTMSGLLYIDLDHFKSVNDRLGHRCGDELLIAVSRRVEATIRASDHAGRLGGDELGVFCPEIGSPDDAVALAERLVRALGAPFSVDGQIVGIGASIGVAFTDHGVTTAADLVDRADRAMYAAKAAGGGRWSTSEPADRPPVGDTADGPRWTTQRVRVRRAPLGVDAGDTPSVDPRVAAVAAAFAHDIAEAQTAGMLAEQLEFDIRTCPLDAHAVADR